MCGLTGTILWIVFSSVQASAKSRPLACTESAERLQRMHQPTFLKRVETSLWHGSAAISSASASIWSISQKARHVTCDEPHQMKNVTEDLMALQELHGKSSRAVPNRAERITDLRAQIPDSFLNTFDRFVARSRKPVSIVRNGMCGECHIRIAAGILGSLAFGQGVQQCGNCGRFLYLPEDESVFESAFSAKSKVHSKKEAAAPVV